MSVTQEGLEFLLRSVTRMNTRIVGDVIPVVFERRRIHGLEPEAVHAERREVIQLGGEPGEIADAVAVAIGERLDVELIEDGVLVPERVRGSQSRHRLSRPERSAVVRLPRTSYTLA